MSDLEVVTELFPGCPVQEELKKGVINKLKEAGRKKI